MKNMRRLSAWIMTALFLFAAITSLFVIAVEADHDCVGEECVICAIVSACRHTVRSLSLALSVAACIALTDGFVLLSGLLSRKASDRKTLVSLKVKLSN